MRARTPIPRQVTLAGPDIVLHWPDGRADTLSARTVRLACRCAACVDELSGRAVLDPDQVPATLTGLRVDRVGMYALRFHWSDGHATGLYPYQALRAMGDARLAADHPEPAAAADHTRAADGTGHPATPNGDARPPTPSDPARPERGTAP
jgi:DUF971 family protein